MIWNSLRLYFRYASISFRSQMEYRTSFFLRSIAQFTITGMEFLGLAALFLRFGHIDGWTLPQVGLFYGIVSVAFAMAEAIPRGFDVFPNLVKSGDFDRILVRPRSPALQILGQEFQLVRVGRFLQGMLVLLWSSGRLEIEWTSSAILLIAFSIVGGACLFSGLFILGAAICFWTIESIEIVNCLTYGGVETAQFPISIYRPWFRSFFTFVVPLATINYFPVQAILNLEGTSGGSLISWISPLAGLLFLLACLQLWRVGVRHYTSTGS
ncbi:MAG TPA: ABC-2 family transporter protein [Terriglobia bacterium]|nr:ABC-2 family transporter protein [Terriglobia bacterium]